MDVRRPLNEWGATRKQGTRSRALSSFWSWWPSRHLLARDGSGAQDGVANKPAAHRRGAWLRMARDLEAVQSLMGHSTASMTLDLYAHVLNDTLTRAADMMAKRLGEVAETEPVGRREPGENEQGSSMGSRVVRTLRGDGVAGGGNPALTCRDAVVGVTGFEPAASSSRTKRATKLRHTPWLSPPTRDRGQHENMRIAEPRPGPATQSGAASRPGVAVRTRSARGEGQQRGLGAAGEPHRRVRRRAQPGATRAARPRPPGRSLDGAPAAPGHQRETPLARSAVQVAVGHQCAVERAGTAGRRACGRR